MKLTISTTAANGHLMVVLRDEDKKIILKLRDNESKTAIIQPGKRYDAQWEVWSPTAADYSFKATVEPVAKGFPISFSHHFTSGKKTGGFIDIKI